MDNFHIDITAEGNELLANAMKIALNQWIKIVGYVIREPNIAFKHEKYNHLDIPARRARMIFLWSDFEKIEGFVPFPFVMDAAGCADFAQRWLANVDYGKQPDHDGDNEKGWRIYNEGWGHVDGLHSAAIAISPAWAMYGK